MQVMMVHPTYLFTRSPDEYSQHFSYCIQELYKQFQLGDESFYAPYINYLMNQPRGRLISEWTSQGKKFLSEMLNKKWDEDDEEWVGGLPPKFVKSYEEVWLEWCKGEDTPLAKAAFYQFTSRDEDTLMVRLKSHYRRLRCLFYIDRIYLNFFNNETRYHSGICTTIATIPKN